MKNYNQLTEEERVKIFELRQVGYGIRSIARGLNRDKRAISREIIRNGYSDSIEYLPDKAHAMAQERKYILPRKIDRFQRLKNYIFTKLEEMWSPDVIAAKAQVYIGTNISKGFNENNYRLLFIGVKRQSIAKVMSDYNPDMQATIQPLID